jgi:small-conductance mechanosensitive channel
VGIGYGTPWRQVEAMQIAAAERTPGLLKQPAPFVFQKALGDFAVTYELNVYCDNAQAMGALYADIPKVVPKDRWYCAPAQKVRGAE